MNWKNHLEVNPAVLVGKPIIKGTRISVEMILDRMANGWTLEQVLESYPNITREDILAALAFAAERMQEKDKLTPRTSDEIEALLRSVNVETSGYKFDRDEANVRQGFH